MHSTSLIPVEGHNNLYRDPKTNAIVYDNSTEYQDYIRRRNERMKKDELIVQTANELQEVKSEISEIKDMLVKLMTSINT
jgi:hypothetical protein